MGWDWQVIGDLIQSPCKEVCLLFSFEMIVLSSFSGFLVASLEVFQLFTMSCPKEVDLEIFARKKTTSGFSWF